MNNVVQIIHADDGMKGESLQGYFRTGETAANRIEEALEITEMPRRQVRRIMDFASGYGRVLRHIRARFPDTEIIAADIEPGAIEFCAETFGAIPLKSDIDFAISLQTKVDIVWVGSLFTHLDSEKWKILIKLFEKSIRKGGLLLFSTAGSFVFESFSEQAPGGVEVSDVQRMQEDFKNYGFAFGRYKKSVLRPDSPPELGRTLVTQEWVRAFLTNTKFELIHTFERGYGNRQDVYVCRRL